MADDDFELEEELLLVAGRGAAAKRARGRRTADSESDAVSDDDDDLFGSDSDSGARGGGRGGKGRQASKGGARTRKAARRDESEEEEDASESASDSEDSDGDDDGYGSDLMGGDDDRERLAAMTELDREMILADRAEERDKARQRKALLKSTKAKEKKEKTTRLSGTRTRKDKDVRGKHNAIRQITAARRRQSEKSKATQKGRRAAGSDSDDSGGRDDAARDDDFRPELPDEDVEDEEALEDEGVEDTGLQREDSYGEDDEKEDAQYEDVLGAQVTRGQLEAWYDKPFFNGEGMRGVVVRVAYGQAAAGQSYMLMVVHDIKRGGKPYAFGPRNSPCTTYLVLVDGFNCKHTMSMANVSNSPLSEAEFQRYERHCARQVADPSRKAQLDIDGPRRMITAEDVREAKAAISKATNYRWDAGKVREAVERKRALGTRVANVAEEKARLRRHLEDAQMSGTADDVARLQEALAALEARQADADAGGSGRAMANLNQRNMQINFNNAFRNVSNKPAGAQERKGGADPFSRRSTRPVIYWKTGAGGSEPEAAKAAPKASTDTAPSKLSRHQMRLDPAQLVRQLDISVDLKQLSQPVPNLLVTRLLGRRWAPAAAAARPATETGVLSIADWKARAVVDMQAQP